MQQVGTRAWRRPARAEDEGILYGVFSSTWQHEVAALPDPALARHFLRIQYTAQDRRFAARYPDLERWASDVDLAWRARLLGWRCVYEPRALAYHVRYYSPTTRAQLPPDVVAAPADRW